MQYIDGFAPKTPKNSVLNRLPMLMRLTHYAER